MSKSNQMIEIPKKEYDDLLEAVVNSQPINYKDDFYEAWLNLNTLHDIKRSLSSIDGTLKDLTKAYRRTDHV